MARQPARRRRAQLPPHHTVQGDLGSFVNVTYRDYDAQDTCDIGNPPSESNNTQACFRQMWVPEGATEERSGWFTKYVVARVAVDPGPGAGPGNDGDPVMTTTYDYIGRPAWAFPDDPLTDDEDESWTEWRGYQQVEVHTGTYGNVIMTSIACLANRSEGAERHEVSEAWGSDRSR